MEVDIARLVGNCECGRIHAVSTKMIWIESGATDKLMEIAETLGYQSGGRVLCDSNTKTYADAIAEKLGGLLCGADPVAVLDPDGLEADEKGVSCAEEALGEDTEWIIAAGAGTIHDIARYIAHKRKIAFISYPTACSVDGYASAVCAMTWRGFKKTSAGVAPAAVVADTDVFSTAPYRLTASGIGDVLGKYVSLADWQCAKLLINEDFCERIYSLMKQSVDSVREYLPAIHAGEKDAYETLMLSLILSGVSMQIWGDSRPASGSEHHLSHLWEMGILNERPDALHGERVGIGLLVALRHYEAVAKLTDVESSIQPYTGMPLPLMRKNLGGLYEDILKENQPDLLRLVSTEKMTAKFPQLQQIIKTLPNARKLRPFMQAAGCATTMEDIGLSRDIIPDSIVMAPFVRRRLTIMRAAKLLPM